MIAGTELPHSFDPSTGLLTYAALGQVDPQILSLDANNLAPRFGLAWSPSFLPHTVIRSGAGIYYADSALIEMQFSMSSPPFNSTRMTAITGTRIRNDGRVKHNRPSKPPA